MKWQKCTNGGNVAYKIDVKGDTKYTLFNPKTDLTLLNTEKRTTDDDGNFVGYDFTECGPYPLLIHHTPQKSGVVNQLPAGVYKYVDGSSGWMLSKVSIRKSETFLDLGPIYDIIADFNLFKSSKHIYDRLNLTYKRNILLWGPPGTGKTSTVNKILTQLQLANVVVIFVNSDFDHSFVEALKTEKRFKMIIIEELTDLLHRHCIIEHLLNFLDGESSLENCYLIATTNYPEKLPGNFVNRPGRFDKFYKLGYLTPQMIQTYWQTKTSPQVSLTVAELDFFDKTTTFAELKEICLMVHRDQMSLKTAINMLYNQKLVIKQQFQEFKQSIGFSRDED